MHGVGDSGTDEKTGGGDGGGRVEDVAIFIRSDVLVVWLRDLASSSNIIILK